MSVPPEVSVPAVPGQLPLPPVVGKKGPAGEGDSGSRGRGGGGEYTGGFTGLGGGGLQAEESRAGVQCSAGDDWPALECIAHPLHAGWMHSQRSSRADALHMQARQPAQHNAARHSTAQHGTAQRACLGGAGGGVDAGVYWKVVKFWPKHGTGALPATWPIVESQRACSQVGRGTRVRTGL